MRGQYKSKGTDPDNKSELQWREHKQVDFIISGIYSAAALANKPHGLLLCKLTYSFPSPILWIALKHVGNTDQKPFYTDILRARTAFYYNWTNPTVSIQNDSDKTPFAISFSLKLQLSSRQKNFPLHFAGSCGLCRSPPLKTQLAYKTIIFFGCHGVSTATASATCLLHKQRRSPHNARFLVWQETVGRCSAVRCISLPSETGKLLTISHLDAGCHAEPL